jgi:hypothetical protein
MSNFWFPKWKEARLQSTAGAALDGTVRAVLLDLAAYTVAAEDEFLADIPAPARVAVSPALAAKTYALGIFDAADVTLPSVPAGPSCEGMALFVDSGDPATSRLVMYLDTVTGLPVTPDSTDIVIHWNAAGIAAL